MKNKNNKNDFSKRTAAQIKKTLIVSFIDAEVHNMGDGRNFGVRIPSSLKNRFALKQAGFILCRGSERDNFINIKAF